MSESREKDGERRRGKNLLVGLGLAAVVLLLFVVTLTRLSGL